MTTDAMIDLDAAQREGSFPDGITITHGGVQFTLPAELPLEVLDPLLSDELDLVGLVVNVFETRKAAKIQAVRLGEDLPDDAESYTDAIIGALVARPGLPKQTLQAFKDCFKVLFGAEQFAIWDAPHGEKNITPSINDYMRLTRALADKYGVSLGEAFASPVSSESGGPTPKPTSKPSTDSTRGKSGAAPKELPAEEVPALAS